MTVVEDCADESVGATGTRGASTGSLGTTGVTVSVVHVTAGGTGVSVGFLVQPTTNGVVARRNTGIKILFFMRKKL